MKMPLLMMANLIGVTMNYLRIYVHISFRSIFRVKSKR